MNVIDKYAKKLQTTVKLIKNVLAGAVAFAVWAVSFVKTSQEEAVGNVEFVCYSLSNYLHESPYCAA